MTKKPVALTVETDLMALYRDSPSIHSAQDTASWQDPTLQTPPWSAFPSSAYSYSESSHLLSSSLPTNINGFLTRSYSQLGPSTLSNGQRTPNLSQSSLPGSQMTTKSSKPAQDTKGKASPHTFVMETMDTIKNQIQRAEIIPKKKRKKTSPDQFSILNRVFQVNPKPSMQERASLALELGMTPRAVQVWFQNRRMKYKSLYGSTPETSHGKTLLPLSDASDMTGSPMLQSPDSMMRPTGLPAAPRMTQTTSQPSMMTYSYDSLRRTDSTQSVIHSSPALPQPPVKPSTSEETVLMMDDLVNEQAEIVAPPTVSMDVRMNETPAMENLMTPPSSTLISPLHMTASMEQQLQQTQQHFGQHLFVKNPLLSQLQQNQMAQNLVHRLQQLSTQTPNSPSGRPGNPLELFGIGPELDGLLQPPSMMQNTVYGNDASGHDNVSQLSASLHASGHDMNSRMLFSNPYDLNALLMDASGVDPQSILAQNNLMQMMRRKGGY